MSNITTSPSSHNAVIIINTGVEMNSGSLIPLKTLARKVNTSRYKTELCRLYQEVGHCKYEDKCQFAHGEHELRNLQRHPKYKTEYCRTFHSVGFCPYGPRCHFVHNTAEMRQNQQKSYSGLSTPPTVNQNSPPSLNSQLNLPPRSAYPSIFGFLPMPQAVLYNPIPRTQQS